MAEVVVRIDNPLFSIITISYNEEKRIQKTLDSVSSQIYKNFEHIIEDGNSMDATCSIVERNRNKYIEGQLRVFSEEDNGLYDAMNRAIARAKGEYICFINSGDHLFDENTLKNVAEAIDNYPNMDWYYGECFVIFPNGDEYLQMPTTIDNSNGEDLIEHVRENHLRLNHQSIFAHRSCFENNLFDTSYRLRAELKWYYECILNGKKIKKLGFPTCKYSYGGLSERAESVAIHAKEMKEILMEYDLLSEENAKLLPKEDDYRDCYKNIYNLWLAALQAGYTIERYLLKNNVRRVAIYGYGELGVHLLNELQKTSIEIVCMIERQDKFSYTGIEIVHPACFEYEVDLIIVTAVAHYKEIRESMKSVTSCKIISLEQVLEELWW